MTQNTSFPVAPLRAAGIGLRAKHYEDILTDLPAIGWIEVHPENYFGGGTHRHYLAKAREFYPLSLHAVGLSLGSDKPVDEEHMKQFKALIDLFEPFQISDHASWSASGNAHLNDLLPLPYTKETIKRLCGNIDRVQNYFGRTILIENPSSYLSYTIDEMPEYEFMNDIAKRTGCHILLDVNNIYVQSVNHGFDPYHYIDNITPEPVREIHLAGHTERAFDDGTILVDTHNRPVRDEVWDLYEHTIARFGSVPTLIEWDGDIPPLSELVGESDKAQAIIDRHMKTQDKTHEAA
ncbi:MAG: DUF692 domain-containing protein [Rhodospirillales bacterium]|nr:DUF692 domain-containing protein [Rhodospirillales bacterium]MCB9994915.1 DUF692 domain-containing protein [Rhodospirillales bacterium]